jgi:tetratricopeptide (TPR) repeat protein
MRLLMAALAAAILAWSVPAAAQVPQADEDAAKAHFLAGSAYYEQANYTDAVKEFIEAHRLSKRPDLLYNISVCYERLGRWDDAIASLQQYLSERPEAPDRAVIESRIKSYEQRRDQEAAARSPSRPTCCSPPARRRWRRASSCSSSRRGASRRRRRRTPGSRRPRAACRRGSRRIGCVTLRSPR